jgi:drug/metabolite transporter (DMT)-like permease
LVILDTTLVTISRTRGGRPVLTGGRDHLTHRLRRLLGTPRDVAFTLAAVQFVVCSITIAAAQAALIRMMAGTVGILLVLLPQTKSFVALKPLMEVKFAALFLFSVIVITFGGFWLSLFAMKTVDITIANTLGSTEPLFVMPLAVILLREAVKPIAVAGTCLAVSGIVIILRPWAG